MRLIEQFDSWQYVDEIARPYEKFFQTWKRQLRSYDSELDCIVIREAHLFDFDEEPLTDGVPWMLKIDHHRTPLLVFSIFSCAAILMFLTMGIDYCNQMASAPLFAVVMGYSYIRMWYWGLSRGREEIIYSSERIHMIHNEEAQ